MSNTREVLERFAAAPEHGTAVDEASERSAVRRWSAGDAIFTDVLPLMAELGASVPVLQADEPLGSRVQYDLDEAGRIVLVRMRRHPDGPSLAGAIDETIAYGDIIRWLLRYEHDGAAWQVIQVRKQVFDDNALLIQQETWSRYGGYASIAYRYDDERRVLERIRHSGDEPAPESIERVERALDGSVKRIHSDDAETWQSATHPMTSSRDAEAVLIDALLVAVSRLDVDDLWMLWLRYTGDGPDWVQAVWPKLSVATNADRIRLQQQAPREWREAWDWNDWTVPERDLPLPDAVDRTLSALAGTADVHSANALMAVVADRLTQRLSKTIIVAIDQELIGLGSVLARLPEAERTQIGEAHMDPGDWTDPSL